MIFPELKNINTKCVNLNAEAIDWIKGKIFPSTDHPLLDPAICQEMVDDVHKKYDVVFSYGGWMEDRSFLWHGSYLDKDRAYIHLGVDLNVPPGTKVATDFSAEVVRIDDDYPEQGGWGPRVILRNMESDIYVVYAHLDREIGCKVGDFLKKNTIFASVGKAPYNGNWFPHLHVQTISTEYFNELNQNNSWANLDGYGSPNKIEQNKKRFPDPMKYISLI
ncbi:MAG: peptidoglycan DD-metalloendopeptidase family protein [Candidatus Pacebacteria bacterium]|nr:peptidoglycan DD-metalloendopeptidase family protein [Candidatus Paceibacterota bacterium]